MRAYLFELRKKLNITQSDVTDIMRNKYGVMVRYGDIERGNIWSKISEIRAEMLANALETTTDYILSKEKQEGGYVGEGRQFDLDNHQLRFGKYLPKEVYSEPLNCNEKSFSERFYSYALKVINYCLNRRFRWAAERNIINEGDIYDIGIIAFLRAVKFIFSEGLNAEDDEKLKSILSCRIKWGISKHIKSTLNCDKRKANSNSLYIDEKLCDDSENSFYDTIPDKALPVSVIAESNCTLSELFSYLNENQQYICRSLIAGYTKKELIASRKCTETDYGIVVFYITQIINYGRIMWSKERFCSGEKGAMYSFEKNKWVVLKRFENHNYNIGYYDDLLTAIELAESAEYHCKLGDFNQWYDRLKAMKTEAFLKSIEAEKRDIVHSGTQRHKIARATIEKPIGISLKKGQYEVSIKGKYLGRCDTLENAVSLRNNAQDHMEAGDFDNWFNSYKKTRC